MKAREVLLRFDVALVLFLVVLSCANGARVRRQVREDTTIQATAELNITKLHIRSDVALRFATTYVISHVINPARSAAEAVFDIRLPKTAFITNFTMEIEGRNYTGTVKEKKKAAQEYREAVSRGQSAVQIKKNPRATDRFSVNVNVEAGSDVTFYLVYQQLLKRQHGLYSDVIYVDPGQIVPDFRIDVHINETREITDLYVPPVRVNDTEATLLTLETNPEVDIAFPTPSEVSISYRPSIDVQKRQSVKGLSGKFVVLYDVLRNFDGGEVAVENGYFVHYFAPSGLPVINKNVLFVLDTSGSMYGTKMRQVKDAMESILAELRPGDFFNVVRFSSDTSRWFTESAMIPASQPNRERALEFVTNLSATGGTNVNDAILEAVNLLAEHAYTHETELSSMIIFLTDGDPTVGVTGIKDILNNVRTRNEGRFQLYSLGFGQTVNFKFLKRLSLQNSGMARKIYEDADAGLQLEGFFRDVATPLLNDVTFDYVGGVNDSTLTKRIFPTYYNGSEIMICGMLERGNNADEIKSVIYARSKEDTIDIELPIMIPRPVPWPLPHPRPEPRPPGRIERLWAYLTINQYLEYMLATTNNTERESYKKKALDLSLKYQFVTDLTSMVVVKPDDSESLPVTKTEPRGRGGPGPNPPVYSGSRLPMTTGFRSRRPVQLFSTTAQRGVMPLPGPHGMAGRARGGGAGGGLGGGGSATSDSSAIPRSFDTDNSPPPQQRVHATRRPNSHGNRARPSSINTNPERAYTPNRKQFGYSFADGDPHFLVTVPGSPQPLCFNVRGEVNSTYLLLNDSVHDVLVSGKMIEGELQRHGNKRRTYFGQMSVKVGQQTLTLTPHKVALNGGPNQSWGNFNASIQGQDASIYMPSRHSLKVRLDTGAVLVVARHLPRNAQARQSVAYLGFYVENIGLLSGAAEGLTGDFAHSSIEDMSRPGSTQIRFKHSDSAGAGRLLRLREISRRNLVTRQRVACLFVDRNGRDVLKRPLSQYKLNVA